MRFPHTLSGLRSIRSAELLNVWVIILTSAISLVALFAQLDSAALVLILLGIPMIVLGIVGLVKQLIGVSRAARDFRVFASARTAIIAAIVLSGISGLLSRTDVPTNLLDIASSACSLYASILILKGIIALCGALRRLDMAEQGQKLIRYVLTVGLLGLALEVFLAVLPETYEPHLLLLILTVLLLALGLLEAFLLLRYYKRAIDMLDYYDPDPGDGMNAPASSPDAPWGVYP